MHSIDSKRIFVSLFLVALLVALVLPAYGQERFGNVTGVVKDQTGAVLPGVAVTITNKDTNRSVTVHSRGDGSYTLADVEPGHYSVTFVKTGFTSREVADIVVLVGRNTSVSIELQVGTVQEMVEVSGAAPIIDTTATMISHNVTAEEINTLPKGRNFAGVAVFSPSVNTGTIEGGYQINGASGAENAYYVDGVSTNSLIDGSSRQTATFDYIQEVQVKTTGLEAEYGGALGGVVSGISKSGGNTFHGDIHVYYSGNKISAGPAERMQLSDDMTTFHYFQDGKRKQDNYEVGGSLGGPIIKNKLFFYTNFSPSWLRQSRKLTFSDGAGTFGTKALAMNWFNKLSFEPTSRVRMNFTWLYTPQYSQGVTPGPNGQAPNVSTSNMTAQRDNAMLGFNQPEQSYTGQIDYTPTNSSVLSVKGGRYRLNYKDTGVTATTEYWWRASSIDMPSVPLAAQQANGYTTPAAGQIVHDLTTRTYVQADFSQFVRLAGQQHNFKFGVGTQKNINNVFSTDDGPNGRVYLYWGQTCAGCTPPNATGTYGYYRVDDYARRGSAGANINHIYVQDSWKAMSRLTINAGVRFEKETIPSFRTDIKQYAFQFGYGDKLAPRLGASFDLFGNGKVKISGGWGRYFDWTKLDLARGTFGADLWHIYYRSLDTTDVFSLGLNNMPGTNLWGSAFRDMRLPGFNYVDPQIKPMSQDSLNAGVEWEIRKNMVFTGRYVRTNLNRTIEDMGVLVDGSEAYKYGNPGEGANTESPSCYVGTSLSDAVATCGIPMPKPKRVYDAMELSLSRRFGNGLLFNASYVYSRLWGNYSGLQSTDEITPPTLGYSSAGNQSFYGQIFRPGGNANRYYDLDQTMINAHGVIGNYGPLPTDRPHVFKFYGAKQFKWGTEIGGFFRVSSGTPVSTQMQTINGIGMYVEGRGDMGRTPVFSQTDLMVAHELKLGKSESRRLRFEFNALNLFNQKTSVFTMDRYNFEETYDSTGVSLLNMDLRNGFDWKPMAAAAALAGGSNLDPRYGKAAMFNPGFQGRFLVKFIF